MWKIIETAIIWALLPFVAIAALAITMNWPWFWLALIVGWFGFVALLYAVLVPAQRAYDYHVLGARPLPPVVEPPAEPPADDAPEQPAPTPPKALPAPYSHQWRGRLK